MKNEKKYCLFKDLGLADYTDVLNFQTRTRQEMIKDPALLDRVFFVQHPRIFTLGKRGGRENLMVSQAFLNDRKIGVVQTQRGGNITYHGPGQAVLYPLVNLERARIGVADFVHGLEEIMRLTALKFNIHAQRDNLNHGLFVKDKKIGSVGISIQKGISIHGLALNVCLDLTPFSWINPCGLENLSMTSMEQESHENPFFRRDDFMDRVKILLFHYFREIFNYTGKEQPHENALPIQ